MNLKKKAKNVAITVEQLEKALEGELLFDGSSIDGFVRIEESDMYLRPDPATFVVFPWRPRDSEFPLRQGRHYYPVAFVNCRIINQQATIQKEAEGHFSRFLQ